MKENTCDRLHYEQVEQFEIKSLQSLRSNTYCQENYLRSIALGMSQKKIDKLTPPTGTISTIVKVTFEARFFELILLLPAHLHRLTQNVE